ncbi:neutral protease [Aplysia californica]|uniref:Neutral protease n=1 Tax=Aplysia californica TaxID=6500 RepID=A0ABM0ZZG9_APLCA|nr:neutral protease [Aplysia californica]
MDRLKKLFLFCLVAMSTSYVTVWSARRENPANMAKSQGFLQKLDTAQASVLSSLGMPASAGVEVLRYFDDPTKDGYSIKHVDQYRTNMNVHASSGVYNHVFWWIGQEIGVKAAFECFLIALRVYWRERSDFEDGACGVLRGTYDAGFDMVLVQDSFSKVGINGDDCLDLGSLVTAALQDGVLKTGLKVSKIRHPLFKVVVPSGKTSLTAEVTGAGHQVTISESHDRSATPRSSGQGSTQAAVNAGETLYIRVFSDSESDEAGEVKVTYS